MAPNAVQLADTDVGFEQKKGKLEIYYDGWFYDVTGFVDHHPGGYLIKFYTEKGEDATQAIQQFHFRSQEKVENIMKSLKKRPALDPRERGLEAKVLTRHESLSKDFKELFEQLQQEGYFEPSLKHLALRLVDCFSLVLIGYGLIFKYGNNPISLFFSVIFLGFAISRFGWLQHEGGHRSLTGNKKIDQLLQDFGNFMMISGSSVWWNSQHNRHHAMPQRLQHDVDLDTLPFVAFHKRVVNNKKDINRFFVRYQHIFYWTLDFFVVVLFWKVFLHPRYQVKKKAYYELMFGLPNFFLMYHLGFFWYLLLAYSFAFFLGSNFALSHSHLDLADKPTHWIDYSFTHTANMTSSIFMDYYMGYLNYQIEHHLFPTMPQFRLKEISQRVKALAEKHGLPYRVMTYPEACRIATSNLAHVGRELTDRN